MNPQRFVFPQQPIPNGSSMSSQRLATGNVILNQSNSSNVNFVFGHPGTYNVRVNVALGGAGRGGQRAQNNWGQRGGGHQAWTQRRADQQQSQAVPESNSMNISFTSLD